MERPSMEFIEDGTFRGLEKGDQTSGKWTILEDGRLKMDASAYGTTMSFMAELEFDGKDIILTMNGDAARFERIK